MNRSAVVLAALAALAACAPDRFRRENADDFAAHAGEAGAFILDVRTQGEYAEGRLSGAKLVPLHELEARLAELPADKKTPIHVYCARGGRSAKAARLLAEKGYESVHDLSGGIAAWTDAGKSVVRGTP